MTVERDDGDRTASFSGLRLLALEIHGVAIYKVHAEVAMKLKLERGNTGLRTPGRRHNRCFT
jgi:hypothetical protein